MWWKFFYFFWNNHAWKKRSPKHNAHNSVFNFMVNCWNFVNGIVLNRKIYWSFYYNMTFFVRMLICVSHSKKHFVCPLTVINKFLMISFFVPQFWNDTTCFSLCLNISFKRINFNLWMLLADFLHFVPHFIVTFNDFLFIFWFKILHSLFEQHFQFI